MDRLLPQMNRRQFSREGRFVVCHEDHEHREWIGNQSGMQVRENGTFLAAAAAIVGLACFLRFYHLGTEELWLDEALSFQIATTSRFGEALFQENTPPFYYVLLRLWVALFGQTEAALRSMSAVFGTLFVAAMIWAGREWFDARVGLWSGVVAAAAPIHVYYSQEARPYVLLTLVLLLSYITLWRALRLGTRTSWILFSVCSALAVYTHYFAVLGLIPTVFLVLVWPKQQAQEQWIGYISAALVAGFLFAPWFLENFVSRSHSFGHQGWVQLVWKATPPILAIPKTLEVFGFGSQADLLPLGLKQFHELYFPTSLRLMGLATLAGLALWVAAPWGEKALAIPWLQMRKLWLAMWLFIPLIVLWVASAHRPMYVVGRYDLIAFPAFSLVLGLALTKIQTGVKAGRVLGPLVAAFLFIPIGTKLFLYYETPAQRPAQAIATSVDTLVEEGEVVIFHGFASLPVIYALHRLGYQWEEEFLGFPPRQGYCRKETARRRFSCQAFPPWKARSDFLDVLSQLRLPGKALWMVYGFYTGSRGRPIIHGAEGRMFNEIRRLGFAPRSFSRVPGLVRLVPQ